MIKTFYVNDENWDTLVKSFSNYDIYYLSGYVKAFQTNGDGEPLLIYFENDTTRAVNVVMKRDLANCTWLSGTISHNQYYDLITPYGYGGFLVDGTNVDSLRLEYEQYCHSNNIVCEFVRFHPILKNWAGLESMYSMIHLGDTVFMDTSTRDTVWANMTSKNRNMVRKAQNSGLKVHIEFSNNMIEPFIEIYNATMERDHADEYYYFKEPFYRSILEDMKDHALWFYAEKDGVITAMSIFLFANSRMNYHLSASKSEYRCFASTNLLLYEAACWAADHGYKTLHMGGGVGSGHDNLYQFKKAFNRGEDSQFWIGKRIFNQVAYDKFVDLRAQADQNFNPSTGFFPSYRSK